jgi:FkbM family methyltransferase
MYPFIRFIDSAVVFYGARLPYHRGKWRVVEMLVKLFRLDDYHRGNYRIVERKQLRWKLDPGCLMQRTLYFQSDYEPREIRWLEKQVRPGWVFLDVGANCGYYSLLVARFAGGDAEVYALEPLQENFDLLNENRALNGMESVRTFKLAFSDRDGDIPFVLPPRDNRGMGRMKTRYDDWDDASRTEVVPAMTMDRFVEEQGIGRVDLIKIDVEGAETFVLAGGCETIRRFRPLMLVEINQETVASFGITPGEIVAAIRALDYDVYTIEGSRLEPLTRPDLIATYRNAVCVPRR